MSKKKRKGTTRVTAIVTTGGVFLLRKVLATLWTKITGKVPPTDLTDPKVTLPEALAWAVTTGIIVETVRFAIARTAVRHPAPDGGAETN